LKKSGEIRIKQKKDGKLDKKVSGKEDVQSKQQAKLKEIKAGLSSQKIKKDQD
jgi:hypothetical protein